MKSLMQTLLRLVFPFAPMRLKCCIASWLGWEIDRSARIGMSYFDCDFLYVGPNSRVGHLNVARRLAKFQVGESVSIQNRNTFTGASHLDWPRSITFGDQSRLRSLHYFDVSGTIVIGERVTVGGRSTQFWSHTKAGSDISDDELPGDISVGRSSYIGASCLLLPGAVLPPWSVLAAGSALTKPYEEEGKIYAGRPAVNKGTVVRGTSNPLARMHPE